MGMKTYLVHLSMFFLKHFSHPYTIFLQFGKVVAHKQAALSDLKGVLCA